METDWFIIHPVYIGDVSLHFQYSRMSTCRKLFLKSASACHLASGIVAALCAVAEIQAQKREGKGSVFMRGKGIGGGWHQTK